MFKPEDFQLTLEAQLKLRVVNDDIDKCTDVEVLRDNLKSSTKLLMNYQQIINRLMAEMITKDLEDYAAVLEKNSDS